MSKFLNLDNVLCFSPHPDDVEYGMLGSMIKHKETNFHILVFSIGGDYDEWAESNGLLEKIGAWALINSLEQAESEGKLEDGLWKKDKDIKHFQV